jgi:hypothetical protein
MKEVSRKKYLPIVEMRMGRFSKVGSKYYCGQIIGSQRRDIIQLMIKIISTTTVHSPSSRRKQEHLATF